jgi:hypothetical protein
MAAPLADEVLQLHGEEALALVAANTAAMRAIGAASDEEDNAMMMQRAHADVASTPEAAVLLRNLHATLNSATEADDVARGRARVARVCRRVRAAADTSASRAEDPALLPHIVSHARARACTAVYAGLALDTAKLLGGAPALARLCGAATPPFLSARNGSDAARVAAAWRALVQDVAAAAPTLSAAQAVTPRGRASTKLRNFLHLWTIGATAEEAAAGKALWACVSCS